MNVYCIKVELKSIEPKIYRKLLIPENITFNQLHKVIQTAMNWNGSHLFEFRINYGTAKRDEMVIGKNKKIDDYLLEANKMTYIYDFGDYWEHQIKLEKLIEDYEGDLPTCIESKGPYPIDDAGGIDGLTHFLMIMNDPTHPEYEDMVEWSDMFDYEYEGNLEDLNDALKKCIRIKKKTSSNKSEQENSDFLETNSQFESYVFKVQIAPRVFRMIQISQTATLDDLAKAILNAFDFDYDHLYAFFMNNIIWRDSESYWSPQNDEGPFATEVTLDDLWIVINKKFAFLFDYGDEWCFTLTLIKKVAAKTLTPLVIKKSGEAPSQYPLYDEDEDEDEEED